MQDCVWVQSVARHNYEVDMALADSAMDGVAWNVRERDREKAEWEWFEARHAEMTAKTEANWDGALLKAGQGCGFVVASKWRRYVITLGDCLPSRPRGEEIYFNLLARSEGEERVAAECLFYDAASDVAVFCCPDSDDNSDAARSYNSLMDSTTPLSISSSSERTLGWLPSHNGLWLPCIVVPWGLGMGVLNGKRSDWLAAPGGVPVLRLDGAVVAIIRPIMPEDDTKLEFQFHPPLAESLPGWMLRACGLWVR
jgi:hypothetical protein